MKMHIVLEGKQLEVNSWNVCEGYLPCIVNIYKHANKMNVGRANCRNHHLPIESAWNWHEWPLYIHDIIKWITKNATLSEQSQNQILVSKPKKEVNRYPNPQIHDRSLGRDIPINTCGNMLVLWTWSTPLR